MRVAALPPKNVISTAGRSAAGDGGDSNNINNKWILLYEKWNYVFSCVNINAI